MLTLPGPIVSVGWLAEHLHDPMLRLADVRWSLSGPSGRERYAAEHLPGAVFLDTDRDLSSPGDGPGRHPIPSPEKLSRVLGSAGIGDEHLVVAYDDAGGSVAARLWWLFRHFGHEARAAVLDGGIDAWVGADLPTTSEPAAHPAARWTPGEPRDDVVDAEAVAARSSTVVLLDARAPERYRGETEPVDARAGHIPGALNAPWSRNLDEDGRFLPAEELRRRYEAFGAERAPVVASCGSGITATHDLLALELAGLDGGRLYEGSWSDWSSDPDRPVAAGAAP
jgi:thiosulfate/3-mercaptopyruvate sulfurtransferase